MPTRMIYPGQVDPPYAGKEWLATWLDARRDPYMLVPRITDLVRVSDSSMDSRDDLFAPSWTTTMLTRHKLWGPAPYVGAPYRYVWWAAVDEHEFGVGGQAWQEYILPFSGYPFTDAELDAALDGYVQRSTAS